MDEDSSYLDNLKKRFANRVIWRIDEHASGVLSVDSRDYHDDGSYDSCSNLFHGDVRKIAEPFLRELYDQQQQQDN